MGKGAPKGRDGRDSSLPILKLVGIGRDDMVVILKNPKWFFNKMIVILLKMGSDFEISISG